MSIWAYERTDLTYLIARNILLGVLVALVALAVLVALLVLLVQTLQTLCLLVWASQPPRGSERAQVNSPSVHHARSLARSRTASRTASRNGARRSGGAHGRKSRAQLLSLPATVARIV